MYNLQIILFGFIAFVFSNSVMAQDDLDAKYAQDLLKPGTEAPAIMTTAKGETVDLLSGYKGKYVVLEFWASWCGDCRADMKYMRRINRIFGSDSIKIQGYSFDKTKEPFEKCVKDSVLAWGQEMSPVTMRESQVTKDYHLNWIPSYYLVGKDGKIILSTVMVEKIEAKLREIAPEAEEDALPLNALYPFSMDRLNMLMSEISGCISYPVECMKKEIEGKAYVTFVSRGDGTISDVVVDKVTVENVNVEKEKYAKLFASSAVKALRSVNKSTWLKVNNRQDNIRLTLPVTFRLR